MRLYIAEKPSMGNEIAKCLSGTIKRHDGYLQCGNNIVTWAFGHILRQAEPQEYDQKYKVWKAQDLPIIPTKWQMFIDDSCQKQFGIIKALIGKADEIVHAGDPDREGQLLIDEILDYVNNKKPVKRILLNALDEKSIKKANETLSNNGRFLDLKKSALARARADWLIGMNLSRAYTLAVRRAGHRKLVLPIGRVKTPTLALVVRRERELTNFKPVGYYIIRGHFAHANGSLTALWKAKPSQSGLDCEGRLVDIKIAQKLLDKFDKCIDKAQLSAYTTTQKKEMPPLAFSLSALQILAGKNFGYEPQQVLDAAQSLYEKKLTTYPRSDCEYLPLNQFGAAKIILDNLRCCDEQHLQGYAANADAKLKSKVWNDKKITAHHAIIPTQVKVKLQTLPAVEKNIYFLVAQRYIAQFYSEHIYDQTRLTIKFAKENFQTTGRTEKQAGWRLVYTNSSKADNEKKTVLPLMKKADELLYKKGDLEKKATKPPARFTPSTLLAGMKEIHKYVKDESTKKKLRAIYGIGTEATRATIIDDLIKRKFLIPEGRKKYLHPTQSAYMLVDILPDELLYPDFTAVWEEYLNNLANGEGSIEDFLTKQENFTTELCKKAYDIDIPVEGKYVCPRCKNGVLRLRNGKNGPFWGCSNYPRCHMTYDDKDGKPDFTAAKTKIRKYINVDKRISGGMISARDMIIKEKTIGMHKNEKYLCPHCKEGNLRRIKGTNGYFWGCSNYPHCTANFDDNGGRPVLSN